MKTQSKCDQVLSDLDKLATAYSSSECDEAVAALQRFQEFTCWYADQDQSAQQEIAELMEKQSPDHLMTGLCNQAFDILMQTKDGDWASSIVSVFCHLDQAGDFVAFLHYLKTQQCSVAVKNAVQQLLLTEYGKRTGNFAIDWDVEYHDDHGRKLHCDIYRPLNHDREEKLPVVLYIHGGAWRYGDKLSAVKRLRHYHDAGVIFVAVEYRLADECKWPRGYLDCVSALDFVKTKGGAHGCDVSRITTWGSSSGSHYASLLAGGAMGASGVKAWVNFCAPLHLDAHLEHISEEVYDGSPLMDLFGCSRQEAVGKVKQACVRELINPKFPVTYSVHNRGDDVVPITESRALGEALGKHGVAHVLDEQAIEHHRIDDWIVNSGLKDFLRKI